MSIALERRLRLLESRVAELERRMVPRPVACAADESGQPPIPSLPPIPLTLRSKPRKDRTTR